MDLTFAAIDLGISDLEKQKILNEILNVPSDYWHFNEFRGCHMLGIYNGGGKLGGRDIAGNTAKGEFDYTPAGKLCHYTRLTLQNKIFPFMDPIGRVTILRTKANAGLSVHLDSTLEEVGTLQHKFRFVLNGNIDKLYFIDKNRNKVFVPDCYDTYIMDGSHAHSLDPGTEEKITLCIGAPWKGKSNVNYDKVLENALYKFTVSRPETYEPEWLDPFFKK